MALKKVAIGLGQSNEDGATLTTDLPAALRGPQANRFVFNYENNAIETLNADAVGLNQPNNNTLHVANGTGPIMRTCEQLLAVWGEVYYFHFAIGGTCMGPGGILRSWNTMENDMFGEFITRWNAFVGAMAALGHTISVEVLFWTQGESDAFNPDGRDRAYYGLFKEFISRIRDFLRPYTTLTNFKWVTGVIGSLLHVNYTYERVSNVRGALIRAGWDDPYYRIVDLNTHPYGSDNLHLSFEGVDSYAIARVAAYQLTTSNAMVLEEYTLKSIRDGAMEEFGIDNTPENKAIIDRRINKAVAWIVNRRKNWPWMERQLSIGVGETAISLLVPFTADRYGTALFTHNSFIATNLLSSGTPVIARELISFDLENDSEALIVESVNGGGIQMATPYTGDSMACVTLDIIEGNPTQIKINLASLQNGTIVLPTVTSTFVVKLALILKTAGPGPASLDGTHTATRINNDTFSIPIDTTGSTYQNGAAQIGIPFRVLQGIFELPEDFVRNTTFHINNNILENTLIYRPPALFEREIKADRITTDLTRVYTIVPDPLNLTNRSYAMVYPYFKGNEVLSMKYFGDAKKLIADDDIPDIPRADRFVVWYASLWFVAQWQKDTDMLAYYRDGALNELERMAKEYQLSDDITEMMPEEGNDLPGPIRGPEGFPEWDEP